MMYYLNDYNAPFHMFGFLFMVVFWGFVLYAIILFIKNYSEPLRKNNALEILKERYAKGEIKHEEFENIKKDIK